MRDNEASSGVGRRRVLAAAGGLAPAAALAWPRPAAAEPAAGDGLIRPMPTARAEWQSVGDVLSSGGTMWDEAFRVSYNRWDLPEVTSHGVRIEPGLAIRTYVAFIRYPDGQTLVMGDLAVTEDELQPLTDALQAEGLAQTSIHKHLLAHSPDLWWSHIHALTDDPVRTARSIRTALAATGTPFDQPPGTPVPSDLDTGRIDAALGGQGQDYLGFYKFTFGRRETVTEHHRVVPWGMGMVTSVGFQPVGDGRAAASGALAVTADEVQPALRALRRGGLSVIELHNHTLTEDPRLFYVHYWAVDDAVALARSLGAAIRGTNVEWRATPAYGQPPP